MMIKTSPFVLTKAQCMDRIGIIAKMERFQIVSGMEDPEVPVRGTGRLAPSFRVDFPFQERRMNVLLGGYCTDNSNIALLL